MPDAGLVARSAFLTQSRSATSRWKRTVRSFVANKGALIGLVILVIISLAAISAPLITQYDPIRIDPPAQLQPPSRTHWMGTDGFGRDNFTRVVYGTRVSLPSGS